MVEIATTTRHLALSLLELAIETGQSVEITMRGGSEEGRGSGLRLRGHVREMQTGQDGRMFVAIEPTDGSIPELIAVDRLIGVRFASGGR